MKGEWVACERVEEVRAAAAGWKRAGGLEADSFEEISRRYPEPRPIPAPLWRALVFFFVSLGILLFLGAFALGGGRNIGAFITLLFVFGAACLAATEFQENAPGLALRGGAGATAFWGIVFLLVGLGLLLAEKLHVHEPDGPNVLLLASLVLWSLAAWRWGARCGLSSLPLRSFSFSGARRQAVSSGSSAASRSRSFSSASSIGPRGRRRIADAPRSSSSPDSWASTPR
jgi:hypothetical protein